jgi:AAHS family 4-hydroxybenzoate transporter-like MFS transporter
VLLIATVRASSLSAPYVQPVMIDVREELARASLGRYHCRLAALIALVAVFAGYDLFNAAYVLHYVIGPWHITPGQAGLLVSSGLLGFSAAALVQGKISDDAGRRLAIILGLWMTAVFSYATVRWADSFWSFCQWRFLTGVGLGVLLPSSVAYMNEIAPRRARTMLATWGWGLGFLAGALAASAAGVFLTPAYGWRVLYDVASTSWLVALLCHLLLPESPQFLATLGRSAEVPPILARLNRPRAHVYLARHARFAQPEPADRLASITSLFSARYRRTTLALSASAFFVLFAIYGLVAWVPTVMMARGETFAAGFSFRVIVLGTIFFGSLACSFVVDRFRVPRAALAAWWLFGGAAVAVPAFTHGRPVGAAAMIVAGFGIAGGLGASINGTASWYDTEVRSTAIGMMLGVGCLGGIAGPYVAGVLQQIFSGDAVVFLSIGGAALLGAISIAFAPGKR